MEEHEGQYRNPDLRDPGEGERLRKLLALPDAEFAALCRADRMQLGGPGGQHRNRVKTGVRLRHPDWPGFEGISGESRDGGRNLAAAAGQLKLLLACVPRHPFPGEPPAFPWKPSSAVSPSHPLRPLWVKLALDALAEEGCAPAPAAARLGWSTSSFLRNLKADKLSWSAAQRMRERAGLPPLKAPGA